MKRALFLRLSRAPTLVCILLFVSAAIWLVAGSYKMVTSGGFTIGPADTTIPYVAISPDGKPSGLLPVDTNPNVPATSDDMMEAAAADRCRAENEFLSVVSNSAVNLTSLDHCKMASRNAAVSMYGYRALDFLHAEAKHYAALAADPNVQSAFPYKGPEDVRGYLEFIDGNFVKSFSTFLIDREARSAREAQYTQRIWIIMWAEAAGIATLIFLGTAAFMLLLRLERFPRSISGAPDV